MRRRLCLLLVVCFLFVGLMGSSVVVNKTTADDRILADLVVTLCHPFRNFQRPNGITVYVGHLEYIPKWQTRRIAAHERRGDVRVSGPEWIPFLVPGMPCCAFSVLPDGTVVPGNAD